MVEKSAKKVTLQKSRGALTHGFNSITSRDWKFAGGGAGAALIFVVVLSLSGVVSFSSDSGSMSTTGISSVTEAQSGTVALTEAELRAEVKKISIPVYWVGPEQGALYTLENQANSRVFVRYLPDGVIPPEGEASKRIVGTYVLKSAFDATKLAGSTVAGGIGFENDDGAAVYYNSNSLLNVYAAFPNSDSQIEIFDPNPGVAIRLASTKGALQQIK